MNFDWLKYINLADELINFQRSINLKEAYYRSSISRAYYGVFCISRNLLKQREVTTPRKDVHKFVITKYRNSTEKLERRIGRGLDRLRKDRNNADYDDSLKITSNEALQSYNRSQTILSLLKHIIL